MISTMTELLAEALFVSDLQPSQHPSGEAVRAAATRTLLLRGSDGCAAAVATEFGDHPEAAVRRMTWVRAVLPASFPNLAPAHAPQLIS